MTDHRDGLLIYSLEALHAHLKEELRKNPFLDIPKDDGESGDDKGPPAGTDGSDGAPNP